MVRSGFLRSTIGIVLTLVVLAPLAMLIATSFANGWFYPHLAPSSIDTSAWAELFAAGAHRDALMNSIVLGLATSVIATTLALPLGRAAALSPRAIRRAIALLAFTAVALPPVALGVGLQLSVLSLGLGGTITGVLLAHLVPALGYLTLVFLGVFMRWDPRVDEAAATLGANGLARWRLVRVPLLRRPIAESLALGFLVSWAQVALTLLVAVEPYARCPLMYWRCCKLARISAQLSARWHLPCRHSSCWAPRARRHATRPPSSHDSAARRTHAAGVIW